MLKSLFKFHIFLIFDVEESICVPCTFEGLAHVRIDFLRCEELISNVHICEKSVQNRFKIESVPNIHGPRSDKKDLMAIKVKSGILQRKKEQAIVILY